ncbi:MAG: thermonuclease family protein [Rhodospirillaceae bacterium]|jgi:micrococcal nuclease|nr:thermonuclease family protein [Rhodospirillaceae bacterium]MBT4589441.1 thermonuclease family protein [Rhodospirillaceae bacterium]MBT4938340.1 thermonuclease family protein [Rhodospirillaceae bacterium]MBT5941011.1 thermonuclease family protein [Rhodospirillaceae bacterium]MBT7267475.1 thermonuclease family protein [Rhodospirillaceae bacterium]
MLIILVLLLIYFPATAAEIFGPYEAEVVRVVDGDTIAVKAFTYPGEIKLVNVRVDGVDTPELNGKCTKEKALAERAKKFTEDFVGQRIRLNNVKLGKFAGRIVADVETLDGRLLDRALIKAELGRFYDGGKRESWCP